jgi:hypothetical protein
MRGRMITFPLFLVNPNLNTLLYSPITDISLFLKENLAFSNFLTHFFDK